jgi:probable phosphoglycerate mutase
MADTIIDLIRHGEPEGGRAYRGHGIDDPLSDKGWQQMWAAVGNDAPWDHIITSPMLRCSDFARMLADKHDLTVTIEDNLKEIGFGTWEGRTPEQIKSEAPDEYENFYRDPVNLRPAGAEDLKAFCARVSTVYESVYQAHVGKHVLIVAHAGVMRAIITHVLQAPIAAMYQIKVDNAGISRIQTNGGAPRLICHNSVLPLEKK